MLKQLKQIMQFYVESTEEPEISNHIKKIPTPIRSKLNAKK